MAWKIFFGLFLMGMTTMAGETNQIRTLARGAFGGIQEPMQVVVTNDTQWAELWEKHGSGRLPREEPPKVNFSKESVIFVSAGKKRTGGYSVEVADVRREDKKTEILVKSQEPKTGGFNIQALTAPFHIVAVPKIVGDVKFSPAAKKEGN